MYKINPIFVSILPLENVLCLSSIQKHIKKYKEKIVIAQHQDLESYPNLHTTNHLGPLGKISTMNQ